MTNKPMLSVEWDSIAIDALKAARQFIANGIELGFITMPEPETPDPAHDTLPMIDRAIAGFKLIQIHGEPVAWAYKVRVYATGIGMVWRDKIEREAPDTDAEDVMDLTPLYAEQPAPVAEKPQCEECKGWGYHENHHEGGGTECGECGGSGKAPAAVIKT